LKTVQKVKQITAECSLKWRRFALSRSDPRWKFPAFHLRCATENSWLQIRDELQLDCNNYLIIVRIEESAYYARLMDLALGISMTTLNSVFNVYVAIPYS